MPRNRNSKQAVAEKGMELPINTLVIVAIAVIVILAVAAFFMGGFGGSTRDIQNKQTFLNTCSSWVQSGCANNDMPVNLESRFLAWQPTKADPVTGELVTPTDITGTSISKEDYLASMCGCFGASVEPRVSTGGSPAPALPAVP